MSIQNKYKNLIDVQSMSVYQIIIVAVCFILNMNDGIDVLVVSFSSSDIIKEWALSKSEMGYVFSAGLAGMALGCFFIAPIADKLGRRKVFIMSLILISLGMLLVGICQNYTQLLFFRLITGMGIGGILPSLAATASEFSNNKFRDFNVGLVQAGWPVGAIFTGFFCAWAIPIYGWRFGFLFAGGVSLLMLLLVIIYVDDSLEFMIKRQPANAFLSINNLLKKMNFEALTELPLKPAAQLKASATSLFTPEYKNSTIKVWIAIFFGFLTLYTLMSWIPNIAKESGLSSEMATYVGIALNVGAAIGTISLGVVALKLGLKKSVLTFMLGGFFIMIIYGNLKLSTSLVFVFITILGMFVQGGFNGMYPIVSRVYPTEIRTTGVGFAMGIGRFGAVLGPTIFGALSDWHFNLGSIITFFAIPLLVTGIMAFTIPSKNLK